MTAETVRRLRCYSKCLFRDADLINVRAPHDGRTDYVIADGPCPKCSASGHITFGELGPADLTNTYAVVGVKVTRLSTIRCTARCFTATSLECKCSCGGEQHGIGRAA